MFVNHQTLDVSIFLSKNNSKAFKESVSEVGRDSNLSYYSTFKGAVVSLKVNGNIIQGLPSRCWILPNKAIYGGKKSAKRLSNLSH